MYESWFVKREEKGCYNAPTSGQHRTTLLERFGTVFRLWPVQVCAFIGQTKLKSTSGAPLLKGETLLMSVGREVP